MPITMSMHSPSRRRSKGSFQLARTSSGNNMWPSCVCARKPPPPRRSTSFVQEAEALLALPKQGAEEIGKHLSAMIDHLGKFIGNGESTATSSANTLTDHATLVTLPLSIVIFGATGDLARKKLFPALYQLCVLGLFPRDVNIVACSRKPVNERSAFLAKQLVNVVEDPRLSRDDFEANITLHAGGYDAPDAFVALHQQQCSFEARQHALLGDGLHGGNRLYLLAVPSTVFGSICELIAMYARADRPPSVGDGRDDFVGGGFTRVLLEKPFGRDEDSFAVLDDKTLSHFADEEIFRLDHYLGKEVILNIPSLRWANQLFEPTWNANHIESVQLTFKEDLGTGGKGGYFDREGIIRDVIQTHLMQAFMWLAMEPPKSMSADDIAKAKVDLLRCVAPVSLHPDECFLGQYTAFGDEPGYTDDPTVPRGSRCPTFASLVLHVDNERWKGVPFLFTAGKGLDERVCELRVRYRPHKLNSMMANNDASAAKEHRNELVMRVQPDEALYMLTVAKEPGITTEQVRKQVCMDMRYESQFGDAYVGDSYERLLLAAGRGDQSIFASSAELSETWRILSPLLSQVEEERPAPIAHPFGMLPSGYVEWAGKRGVSIHPTWKEFVAMHADLIDEIMKLFSELDIDNSGGLEAGEVAALAKRLDFDGREPTPERIEAMFNGFDLNDDGKITLDELIAGAQKLHRAFSRDCNKGVVFDSAGAHVHI